MSEIRNGMRPIHPGEILREEFLLPLNLSANALARIQRMGRTPACLKRPAAWRSDSLGIQR